MKSSFIITGIIIIVLAFFVGKTSINLYPFKIKIDRPFYLIGFLLIMIVAICMFYQDYKNQGVSLTVLNLSEAQNAFTKHNSNDGFIQWKGTNVCMDFHCDCGWHNHYDDYFAYEVECFQCGEVYAPSSSVEMIRILEPCQHPVQSIEADEI